MFVIVVINIVGFMYVPFASFRAHYYDLKHASSCGGYSYDSTSIRRPFDGVRLFIKGH